MKEKYIINGFELDDYQSKILKFNGNMLVVAGAGSGKTLTIMGKIKYLIENKICEEKNILIISFTNASVADLKKKISYNIEIFTFHKLAIKILEKADCNYSLASDTLLHFITQEKIKCATKNEQKIIMKFLKLNQSYNDFLKSKRFEGFCNFIITFINLYKTNNYNKEDILKIKYTLLEKNILVIIFDIYHTYIIEKNSENKLDFDDLIIYATKAKY